jgi:hypothetical protein
MLGSFVASNEIALPIARTCLKVCHRVKLLMGSPMYTEHTQRHQGAPRAASAVDRSNPLSPRRLIAQDIILSRRRLRQHVAVAASLGVCLATLLLAFD